MVRLRSAFELDVFSRRNAKSDRLPAFITIYVQHFGPEHRTKTNELVDFLVTPQIDRTITYFGLTYEGRPCGFATFMHYPEGPFGIVDHMVLAPTARGYGAFFAFCDLIAKHLEKHRIMFDHILAEVMLNENQIASTIKPIQLLRLMRMVGFRVARTAYWAPDPTIVKKLESCKAALLFASQPERDSLSSEEFNRIVEIIYLSHYQGWYRKTMSSTEFLQYKIFTDKIKDDILRRSFSNKRIILNGMKNIDFNYALTANKAINITSSIYISLILFPAIVGLAVAFTQERLVATIAATGVFCFMALFVLHPYLNRILLKIFRLSE